MFTLRLSAIAMAANCEIFLYLLAVSGCSVKLILNLSGHRFKKLDQSSLALLKQKKPWECRIDAFLDNNIMIL